MPLTVESLAEVMGNAVSLDRYRQLFPALNQALIDCGCDTVNRAAMWFAQIGHESGGLRWMEELASGAAYNGRADLGNLNPGDGERYKGRGPIQITGRYNYGKVSKWAYDNGYVPSPNYFVDNPSELSSDRYGFLGVIWYWTVARPMNLYADQKDLDAATKAVNGGYNGLQDRRKYYTRALIMGDRITPWRGNPQQMPDTKAPWRGDPTWLKDVLEKRPLLKGKVKDLIDKDGDGYTAYGHGDFKELRGVVWHHTGNTFETAQSIRDGRSDLPGPLANIHIGPDGTVTLVALGVCWHAGEGSYPWLPEDNANFYMIGVECAWPTPNPAFKDGYNPAERWPDAQVISMREVAAAISIELDKYGNAPGVPTGSLRNIDHKEWAGAKQGKWDRGNMDPNWFRGEVWKSISGKFDEDKPDETPTSPTQPGGPSLPPNYDKEVWDQLRIEWDQLGGRTLVNAIGAIGEKLGVEGMYDLKNRVQK